ncbi:MAG: hypothetical protein P4L43_10810 [Syntrophobacteraceae bacterium]|nr:hypothetical protein [Syntrophobacteraceae bacterium]
MDGAQLHRLQAMSRKIKEVEEALQEVQRLGEGAPVIEKNVRSILSLTHALRFGICDLADMEAPLLEIGGAQ